MKIKENFNQLLILIVYKLKDREEETKFLRQNPAKDVTMELLLGKKKAACLSGPEKESLWTKPILSVLCCPLLVYGIQLQI